MRESRIDRIFNVAYCLAIAGGVYAVYKGITYVEYRVENAINGIISGFVVIALAEVAKTWKRRNEQDQDLTNRL